MKIEIDFSKPDELRKTKRDLEMALSTIETALSAIGKNSVDPKQTTLPQIQTEGTSAPAPRSPVSILDSESPIAHLVDRMGSEFTSSDMFSAAKAENIPRSQIRRGLASLIEGQWLILVDAGKGRRPSRFRKA